ncbi:MAG: membrane protein insertion efficiency factor YidD [Gordonia sp.]|jgi:putative membrane protein insertion efficiency factor|uniref:membrane protein insertion efficiency factor YidD n=2 Tax=Gordonia sp. (in: high G+C Gram-positive bacteria) TaxID=84139 RepID=UPI001D91FC7F|nr:membrane protein insertion efficiency factor YidD [Gordonia sp. (in: high G+C Gram-positive bacteria)]MCB1297130.1 membrane protein insertion efficiency factor YidD [Gordonia sp. (in: high G+C Gram-positive bacteria)]
MTDALADVAPTTEAPTDVSAVSGQTSVSEQTSAAPSALRRLRLFPRHAVIFMIELYRSWISPMRMPTCRFEPSCSAYAVDALNTHGLMHGGTLTVMRLLKCGPWHKPGYDPVPERGLRFYLPGGRRETEPAIRSTHTRRKG